MIIWTLNRTRFLNRNSYCVNDHLDTKGGRVGSDEWKWMCGRNSLSLCMCLSCKLYSNSEGYSITEGGREGRGSMVMNGYVVVILIVDMSVFFFYVYRETTFWQVTSSISHLIKYMNIQILYKLYIYVYAYKD